MSEPEGRASLKDLDARLKAARETQAKAKTGKRSEIVEPRGWGLGFRLSIDMVSGLLAGIGLGLLLDYWLGTGPLFLVLFFFMGAAAGMLNVYRTANRQGLAVGYSKAQNEKTDETKRDDQAGGKTR
ncbi:MAG: AtpZ/AtpI family protein [Kiloniellales bacterium]|nr:AtpZ/AtpI family protein [Kiloniellales bacterium]